MYDIKMQVGRLQTLQGDTHKLLSSYIAEEQQKYQARISSQADRQTELENQISELREEVRQLKRLLEEMRFSMGTSEAFPRDDSTEATLSKDRRASPSAAPDLVAVVNGQTVDGATLLNTAREAQAKGKYENARNALQTFLEHFPYSPEAEEALFSLADTYFYEGKYEDALKHFLRLPETYPASGRVPDSLVKAAICLTHLNRPQEARDLLNRVIREFPNYQEILKVKDMVKTLDQK